MKIRLDRIGKNYRGNSCNVWLKGIEDGIFDFIREDQAFADIVAKLKEYAE